MPFGALCSISLAIIVGPKRKRAGIAKQLQSRLPNHKVAAQASPLVCIAEVHLLIFSVL